MNQKRAVTIASRRAAATGLTYSAVPLSPTHWTVEPTAYLLSAVGRRAYPLVAQAITIAPPDPSKWHEFGLEGA